MGAMEQSHGRTVGELPPVWVGARHVANEHAVGFRRGVKQEREMADLRLRCTRRDQGCERVFPDHALHRRGVARYKRRRLIDAHFNGSM